MGVLGRWLEKFRVCTSSKNHNSLEVGCDWCSSEQTSVSLGVVKARKGMFMKHWKQVQLGLIGGLMALALMACSSPVSEPQGASDGTLEDAAAAGLETPAVSTSETATGAAALGAQGIVATPILPDVKLSFVNTRDGLKAYGKVKLSWTGAGPSKVYGKLSIFSQNSPVRKELGSKTAWLTLSNSTFAEMTVGPFSRRGAMFCLEYRWYVSSGSPAPDRKSVV